jgi:hypothetical protein
MEFRPGVVRGISYGLFGPPDGFVPAARALGAGLVRAYLYWGQVEPRPGEYRWDVVDALLAQLDGGQEVWLTLCSSSPWATRQPTDFLPPSPAHDLGAYRAFVAAVVRRCAGRVRFWQCDNEPSNTGLLWAGTADEYLAQLAEFHGAVRETDPAAVVVLGGCGYDVFASEPGSAPRRFFDRLLDAGRDHFDAFDAHLYGDPARAAGWLAEAAGLMAARGYTRPVLVGEHAGPVPFQFPAAEAVLHQVMVRAFAEPPGTRSTAELIEQSTQDTPERRAMTALYDRMDELPPRLAMFLVGCPPELAARRHRINARTLVMHTVLALAAGVPRTVYWNLAPEVPGEVDPRQLMGLMFGKLPLLSYQGRDLTVHHPAADTFALLATALAGATAAIPVPAGPETLRAYRVDRTGRGPLLVLWDERDLFDGEDEPPVEATVSWAGPATVTDAFGTEAPGGTTGDRLTLLVGATPLLVRHAAD